MALRVRIIISVQPYYWEKYCFKSMNFYSITIVFFWGKWLRYKYG